MRKIQYGIAGFFAGAFGGLLAGLIEMKVIDGGKNPATLFFAITSTVLIAGILGMRAGIRFAKKTSGMKK